jgi:hypothetical protein
MAFTYICNTSYDSEIKWHIHENADNRVWILRITLLDCYYEIYRLHPCIEAEEILYPLVSLYFKLPKNSLNNFCVCYNFSGCFLLIIVTSKLSLLCNKIRFLTCVITRT